MKNDEVLLLNRVRDKTFISGMFGSIQAKTSSYCFQCKTCTNGCPIVMNFPENPKDKLDLLPHQLMYAVRLGLKQPAMESRMLWACTECYMCTDGCPQGVAVCDVIYELKNLAMIERKDLIPRGIRLFANTLLDNGRSAEIMDWEREELELPELSGAGDETMKELLIQRGLAEIIGQKS